MKRRWAAASAAMAMLAACSQEAPAPGALSAEDERRLNEAAEMLDANMADSGTMPDNRLAADR